MASQDRQAPRPQLRDPIQFLAFGLGSGLSPRAPGTVGSLAALPIYLALTLLPPWTYAAVVVLAAIAGIYICDRASRALGVHDHPGIVWDEFVGMWIALWSVPVEAGWILFAFLAFRFFDVLKPWPIRWLDRRVGGGFGIMIDDVVAGLMAWVVVQLFVHGSIAL